MKRKLIPSAVTLSLCLGSITPALAQDYRFAGHEGAPGANATLNLRVPLGTSARRAPPTFGLTLGYGRVVAGRTIEDQPGVRQMRLADVRFGPGGLSRAELANFNLVQPARQGRLNADENDSDGDDTVRMLLIGILGIAVGVGAEMILDGSSEEEEEPETPGPISPGLG